MNTVLRKRRKTKMAHASNPNEEKELEQLLTEQYNYLVRHISTREFIPHLISKEVLTTEDKEEIESKVTSVDRAGRPSDIYFFGLILFYSSFINSEYLFFFKVCA